MQCCRLPFQQRFIFSTPVQVASSPADEVGTSDISRSTDLSPSCAPLRVGPCGPSAQRNAISQSRPLSAVQPRPALHRLSRTPPLRFIPGLDQPGRCRFAESRPTWRRPTAFPAGCATKLRFAGDRRQLGRQHHLTGALCPLRRSRTPYNNAVDCMSQGLHIGKIAIGLRSIFGPCLAEERYESRYSRRQGQGRMVSLGSRWK